MVSQGIERSGAAWFDDRREDGWVAEYDAINTRGYPYRFDTTLETVTLADPGTGVVWSAPEFEIVALAYQPNHIIALFPATQTLASPLERLTLQSDDMRASVRFTPGTALALDQSTAELAGVQVTSDNGWQVTLDKGLAAVRRTPASEASYDVYFNATDLRPNDALRLGIDPSGRIPDTFQNLTIDAAVDFTQPWDRFSVEDARPQPTRIDLRDFDAAWGRLGLRAVGVLDIDAAGIPEGRITVKATNWREIVSLGEATGVIPSSFAPSVTRMLEVLATMSGPPNTIDTPITFKNGRVSLGPLPLGPAPRIRLR